MKYFFPIQKCIYYSETPFMSKDEKITYFWINTTNFKTNRNQLVPLSRSFLRYMRMDVRNYLF